MRERRFHREAMHDGFSLVEVIIAVTLLAVMTIPILAYFTNASVSTSKGKNTQRANVAGETVMEELNSIESFEKLEASPEPSSTGLPDWTVSVNTGAKTADVVQEIQLDGFWYHVEAKVDYNYANQDSSGKDSYNAYKVPELKEVYSTVNAVIEETDQAETALSEFYYENQSKTKASILNDMKRTLCVDVEQTTDAGRDIYWVKGYYKYFYGGEKKVSAIRNIKMEKGKLENIYFFYKVLNNTIQNEPAEVRFKNFTDNTEISRMKLYFVLQNSPATSVITSVSKPTDYKLAINDTGSGTDNPEPFVISGAGDYQNASYYTNGIPRAPTSSVDNSKFFAEVVKHDEKKRIAKITVDVYEQRPGSTSYPESERLVRLESSKGE